MWLEWLNTINWNGLVFARGAGAPWIRDVLQFTKWTKRTNCPGFFHVSAGAPFFFLAFSHSQLVSEQIKYSWECWCRPAARDPLGIGRNRELGHGRSCAASKQPCTEGRGPGGSTGESWVIWGYLKWSIKPLNFNQGCYYTDRHDLLTNQ